MVTMTNAHRAKQRPAGQNGIPANPSATGVPTPAIVAQRNCSRRLTTVDLRQASRGPTPVRNSRMSPMGSIHLLKNGGPTVNRSPAIASLSVGNMVANSTNRAAKSRTQLFARNAASRETQESSSWRALSSGRR